MHRIIWISAWLAGCAQRVTHLADLRDIEVGVGWTSYAPGEPRILHVGLASASGCPTIDIPSVARGGIEEFRDLEDSKNVTRCNSPGFELASLPSVAPGTTSTLVIADESRSWEIDVPDLRAPTLTLVAPPAAGATLEIRTNGVSTFDRATVELHNGIDFTSWETWRNDPGIRLKGNAIEVDIPSDARGDRLRISTTRTTPASRCSGPAKCSIAIDETRELAVLVRPL